MAGKVRDTLAGLAAARMNATGSEKEEARRALNQPRWRVALHLEQVEQPSRLRPTIADPASVRTELRKAVKAIDARAVVVDSQSAHVPWAVRRL